MKGSYILLLTIEKEVYIEYGKNKGAIFKKGLYAYIGSALSGLTHRINRHFSKKKKVRWHIDSLTLSSRVLGAIIILYPHPLEEVISEKLSKHYSYIQGFGSSDKKSKSHLYYLGNDTTGLMKCIIELTSEISNIRYKWWPNPNHKEEPCGAAGGI